MDRMAKQRRRPYGTGSLIQRGRVWWLRYYAHGQHIQENSKTEDRQTAENLLKQRIGEAASGKLDTLVSRATVADICNLVLADHRLRNLRDAKTLEWRYVAHVKPGLGRIQANRMTSAQIRAYIEDRRVAGASEATINRELSIVRRAYTLAMREEPKIVREAPYIPKLEENDPRQGFIEQHQYKLLLAELPDTLKALFVCGYHVGCRKNELRRVRWEQVDFEAGLIALPGAQTKNKKPRSLPIYGDMETWLRVQYANRPEANPWVFNGARNRPVGDHLPGWTEACERAGFPGLLFHDLRRSAVRNMERAGVARSVAMKISGHRTEATYRRYDIVSQGDLEVAKQKLTDYARTSTKLSTMPERKRRGSR
jgi:integrase